MKKMTTFAFSIVLLLLITGCGNTNENVPSESTPDSVTVDEQLPHRTNDEPVTLNVSNLNDIFAALDLSEATLTYHGKTEATYPANAAIRAERYIEKLKSFTWREYTPLPNGMGISVISVGLPLPA